MPDDVVKKQTIKQAKASFKARGRPTLSDREARQLERAIDLEQRAERAKEAEKRRLIAAGKREQAHKLQQQQHVQLGTQRRCDRFGHKSSQFHLGAFFGKNKPPSHATTSKLEKMREQGNDRGFGDDDLDDESLLDACDGTALTKAAAPVVQTSEPGAMLPPRLPGASASVQKVKAQIALALEDDYGDCDDLDCGTQVARALAGPAIESIGKSMQQSKSGRALPLPAVQSAKTSAAPRAQEDVSDFFDHLESGTQIARELGSDSREVRRASNASGSSFGSGSLDLTEEDMEMMTDPPKPSVSVSVSPSLATTASWPTSAERQLTPAVSVSTVSKAASVLPARETSGTMPKQALPKKMLMSRPPMLPPTLPVTRPPAKLVNSNPRASGMAKQHVSAIRGPFVPAASSLYCSPDLGFTSTQLESFIDDDLQLTQVG